MIEKILKKIEEIRMIYFLTIANGGNEKLDCAYVYVEKAIDKCKEIVQEVAKEYEDKANEAREDFMEIVYAELEEDADNNRANRIIDAFDTYAPYQKGE